MAMFCFNLIRFCLSKCQVLFCLKNVSLNHVPSRLCLSSKSQSCGSHPTLFCWKVEKSVCAPTHIHTHTNTHTHYASKCTLHNDKNLSSLAYSATFCVYLCAIKVCMCVGAFTHVCVCLQGSDPCCLVCFSIKRAVKEREQMAAGPFCPASSHNCHTSCASINLLSLLLPHNFIKTTQERVNNKPAQLSWAKDPSVHIRTASDF